MNEEKWVHTLEGDAAGDARADPVTEEGVRGFGLESSSETDIGFYSEMLQRDTRCRNQIRTNEGRETRVRWGIFP